MSARGGLSQAPGDEIYIVERILKKRRHPSKGIMYLVKWRNFPNSANTWEPACNFSQKLIESYESKHKKGKKANVKRNHGTSSATVNTTTPPATAADTSKLVSNDDASMHLLPSTSLAMTSSPSPSPTSTSTSTIISDSSTESGSHKTKPVRGRPRKDPVQRRQQQFKLQMDIQEKQKTQAQIERQQLAVFNPVGNHYLPIVREVVYEPELTKEPIIVTDVTTRHSTVTISECLAPEGFFCSPIQ